MARGLLAVASVCLLVPSLVAGGASRWERAAPLPLPRSEVAAAAVAGEIAVVGGFLADGGSSARVDIYSPALDRWRRLPDLPRAVNHAMAGAWRGRLYVVGGYAPGWVALRRAFVFSGGAWRKLPPLPAPRAAGGAAVVGGKLYVVGGVGAAGLAKSGFALDLERRRWSVVPGPTPREHLGVAATGGRVYAVGGRTGGFDTNLDLVEAYAPAQRRWRRLPPLPDTRGGTAAAAFGNLIVSAGGEETRGTIAAVYGYDVEARRWKRLPDLLTPRHGLGLAAVSARVYAIAGGTQPGLSVSGANEFLRLR